MKLSSVDYIEIDNLLKKKKGFHDGLKDILFDL